MKTICHFLNYASFGGTVDMIVSLIRRSAYNHIYVTYEATQQRREEFKEYGIELVELGRENYDGAVKFMKENADIVHASFSGGPEPGVSIGLAAEKPTVETCQSPNYPQGSMHPSVKVIPVSNGIVHGWPEDLRYERVIYSCAEPIRELDRFEAKTHFGLDPNRPVVGRLGRLEGLKRPADFINTVRIIRDQEIHPNIQFLLAGDGNDGNGVRGMITTMELDIKLPGFLTGEEKELAYNAMDVFLYPTSFEGFGIVFAEAMSIGLPIVTYSDLVNTEIVGGAGVFAVDNLFMGDVSDPYLSLASLTIDLLENPREAKKLHDNGKKLYRTRYTPQRLAGEYDKLYEEMLSA